MKIIEIEVFHEIAHIVQRLLPLNTLVPVLDKTTATGRDPRDVAQVVLKAVCHKTKDVMLAGALPTLAVYIRTMWPSLFFKLMASRAGKERKCKEN